MKAFFISTAIACLLAALCTLPLAFTPKPAPTPPAKTETLNCVRVKEVAPGGKINYLCEVRK